MNATCFPHKFFCNPGFEKRTFECQISQKIIEEVEKVAQKIETLLRQKRGDYVCGEVGEIYVKKSELMMVVRQELKQWRGVKVEKLEQILNER